MIERLKVSTRAPAKGATIDDKIDILIQQSFNSRSREGSDGFVAANCMHATVVSTRAPAKGATPIYFQH